MVTTVGNLASSSATSAYFRQDGGYYVGDRQDHDAAPYSPVCRVEVGDRCRALGCETGIQARTSQWFPTRWQAVGENGRAIRDLRETFGSAMLVLDEASMVRGSAGQYLRRSQPRLRCPSFERFGTLI